MRDPLFSIASHRNKARFFGSLRWAERVRSERSNCRRGPLQSFDNAGSPRPACRACNCPTRERKRRGCFRKRAPQSRSVGWTGSLAGPVLSDEPDLGRAIPAAGLGRLRSPGYRRGESGPPGGRPGPIARCRQIVVVGDKKQLPPTSFFDRMIADEADPHESDDGGEPAPEGAAPYRSREHSVLVRGPRSRKPDAALALPLAASLSDRSLQRRILSSSRHAASAGHGTRWTTALTSAAWQGAYDRGGQRTNPIEAEADRRRRRRPRAQAHRLSLGLSPSRRRNATSSAIFSRPGGGDDPVLERYLADGGPEDVFVKNLENVQGDERDVILISIGYGPREAGQPLDSMAFGPISAEGGERRLNVLFTRARVRCEVFVSFGPGDINLERATGEGPRVLKRFLQYRRSGVLDESRPTGADFNSPFEAAVADGDRDASATRSTRKSVRPGLGSTSRSAIPPEPAAICSRSSAMGQPIIRPSGRRERDRLRQQVLEDSAGGFIASGARIGFTGAASNLKN